MIDSWIDLRYLRRICWPKLTHFSSVPSGKRQDSTSVRARPLPSKSLHFITDDSPYISTVRSIQCTAGFTQSVIKWITEANNIKVITIIILERKNEFPMYLLVLLSGDTFIYLYTQVYGPNNRNKESAEIGKYINNLV